MSKTYYPTIGLEIHAELNTKSKMFCGCKNDPDETKPNTHICPICMAHPGTLPTANKAAIESVIKVGLALEAEIADFSEFDRKHYFYPDIPKGYQISQYKYPIVSGGVLNGVAITRIHIEEDTATSKHDRGDFTLVDYNRAGVPLMELVTEPVIHSAKQAGDFAKELQLLLRTLGVAEANMEKGEMRVEANISLSDEEGKFGTKVEVKNLNSFRSAERAIEYELARMEALYEAGRQDEIVQETRGWDESKQSTFSQRSKENANDYRYFPEPDIPKMQLHRAFAIDNMKAALPELPWQKRDRYTNDFGLKSMDIESYVTNQALAAYFEEVVAMLNNKDNVVLASNFILNDLGGVGVVVPALLAETVEMVASGELSSRAAKDILLAAKDFEKGQTIRHYAQANNLLQSSDIGSLKPVIEKIIADNPKIVADYKSGKEAAIQGLVGQVMKETKGSANPSVVLQLIKDMVS